MTEHYEPSVNQPVRHLTRVVTPKALPWAFEAECSCGWVSAEFETHADALALATEHEQRGVL